MKSEIPSLNLENPESDHERIWREKVEKVGKRLDRIGGEMDPGIIEAVAALNLHRIPTSGSCEGHLDHGIPSPWIAVEAEHRPAERYNDQNKIYEEIAKKHGITVAVMRDGNHKEEWHEACIACNASGETEAYKLWQRKNAELRKQVQELIQEYEKQRNEKSSSTVSMTFGDGPFRIFTGGQDHNFRAPSFKELSKAEQEALALRLLEHQAEMKRFMEYLKQRLKH
ncbi:MAG TPA: hypothetical protein VJH94_04195 [Candidatus Paceibacterota bacterium]